jgi:hypothetical protein
LIAIVAVLSGAESSNDIAGSEVELERKKTFLTLPSSITSHETLKWYLRR